MIRTEVAPTGLNIAMVPPMIDKIPVPIEIPLTAPDASLSAKPAIILEIPRKINA